MRASTTLAALVVAFIVPLGAGCGGGSGDTASPETTEPETTTSERYAGVTRDHAISQATGTVRFFSEEDSVPEPTVVKKVSYYDCQVQRKGACGDQPLLHAWYVYWAEEPFRGCVYVSSSGPVVGPSCDLTESVLTVHD
jgi:hypothetical protein